MTVRWEAERLKDELISVIRRQVRKTGFDVRRVDSQASLDLLLSKLCRELQITCMIDVGANEGQFARSLRDGGFRGQILSFEPSPLAYSVLKDRAERDADWHALQMALGSKAEVLELKVFENSLLSSLREPDPSAVANWAFMTAVKRTVQVQVRRLDSILPETVSESVFARSFLKIDTQGWDSEVIIGSEGVIRHMVLLQTELSFKALYTSQPSYRDVLPWLESLGFEMVALFPITRDRNFSLIEADCVMVRRDAFATAHRSGPS